jgi:cutinase
VYDRPDNSNIRILLTTTQNIGSSVGPALVSALESALGADGVAIQGVDYEASIASNANQGREGGPVVSNAIASSGVNPDDIAAAVLYGDPSRTPAGGLDSSKVKDYCTSGDGVCAGTFAISAAHLAYTRYVRNRKLYHNLQSDCH